MTPSREADKYIIRFPDGMRERIRERAAANRRSMNAEIVHYLDRALDAQEAKGPAEAATSPSHVTHQLPA
ncbi:Arc family DNA-binding protein [Aminobacter sp. LjRoot7]|uniref:Arc family DNA-binding protein n=1 Tax=Aminobacter sp. LjRoot7 TaxID=3342335 RepID=UPI003ECEA827